MPPCSMPGGLRESRTGWALCMHVDGHSCRARLDRFACPAPPTVPPCPPGHSHLFRYYHERLPSGFPFPATPAWKAGDSPDREDAGEEDEEEEAAHMAHDDVIGEAVSLEGPAAACFGA